MISALLLCLLPALPQAVAVQDSTADRIAAFKKVVQAKDEVPQTIAHLDGLVSRFQENQERMDGIRDSLDLKEGDPRALKKELQRLGKEQEALVSAIWLCFSAKHHKRVTQPNMQLWKAALFAYGQMGPLGAERLWKVFGDKRFRKDVEFRALVVRQIGYTHDFDQWAALVDTLDYKDEQVIAAAAEALAQFGDAPGKIRKECVKKTVRLLEGFQNDALDNQDTTAQRIYRTVRGPMIRELTALTGQSFRDPLEWVHWWNKNKNRKEVWKDD